jgi:hypothetical protein
MKATLTIFFVVAALQGFSVDLPASASSPSNASVAWGKQADGLRVAISCDVSVTDSRSLPEIFFYVANAGDQEIKGIIQSGARCIVIVNGLHYAQEFHDGKSSTMPPDRNYGPIPISSGRLKQIPELRVPKTIGEKASRPELRKGTNTLSVHYILGTNLVESGEVKVVAKWCAMARRIHCLSLDHLAHGTMERTI